MPEPSPQEGIMKSKPLALFIALLAALSLLAAACGGSDADDASSDDTASSSTSEDSSSGSGDDDAMEDDEPAAPAGPLKVAVVAPSASNDLAFSQSMVDACLLYTSPSPRDGLLSRMPSSA